MITRKASEIIRLAENMAQIQNADMFSWEDKIDILNQSYTRIYTDLTSSGELYYVRESELRRGADTRFHLPPDLWKLVSVGFGSLRAPNVTPFRGGYRVENNILTMPDHRTNSVVIRYIPKPQTVTFPRKPQKLEGRPAQACYDSLNDILIFGNPGNITVHNRRAGTVTDSPVDGEYVMAISRGILYVVRGSGIACFDYGLTELSTIEGGFPLFVHGIGWKEGIIVKTPSGYGKYVSGGAVEDSPDYWNYGEGTITRDGSVFTFTDELDRSQDISAFFIGADSYVIASPYIYVNVDGNVRGYYGLEKMEPEQSAGRTAKGVVLAADCGEDGYGFVFNDYRSGLWLKGYSEDTLLDYPKNIFFDWITADLAVKLRIAADIPTGELPALADDYYSTLIDGIRRDTAPVRIGNVYAGHYV
jgi:hypothetical protein